MKDNWKRAFMDTAKRFAEESYAVRLQVGAIVVKDDRIISIGINGMPSGWENICEYKYYQDNDLETHWNKPSSFYPYEDKDGKFRLETKPETLHAESNALAKLAKTSESGDGASLFVTHSPCIHCAKSIYQAGIKEVYYATEYRSSDGIDFLKKCDILVEHIQ